MEGGVAVGFGAIDAIITSKVKSAGPGGIPWPVIYEVGGLAVGMFGGKVDVPSEVRDTVLVSSLALLGSRGARLAMSGKLLAGPKAWGGINTADAVGGHAPSAATAARQLRALPGGRGGIGPGGWYAPQREAAGVVG